MKLNWNFQRGGEVVDKIPFVEEVWIFSGTTQYELNTIHNLYNSGKSLNCYAIF